MGQQTSADSTANDLLAAALAAEARQRMCERRGDWDGVQSNFDESCRLLEQASAASG